MCLEHLYHQVGLLVRRYPRRGDFSFIFYDKLIYACHFVENVNVVPAPETPKSHSSAARQLQRVERQLGSLIDLVVETPQSPC